MADLLFLLLLFFFFFFVFFFFFFVFFFLETSSPSPSPSTWKYRTFTSFHGPDVRKTFLSHLRKQFDYNGITMFDDEGIERSQTITTALTQAIRESRISIVVLSKNYASSSWCLDELLEILKCKEDAGQIVMTVFYGVDPSDVRKQTGEFGIAFKETCARRTKEKRRKWTHALTCVGNIAGEHFQQWKNEAKMIEKIASDVSDKLNATPSKDFDDMVGLETHLKEMESFLDLDYDRVKMVGISGPAGSGKSTIARALYSRLSSTFHLSCFIDNLRESYANGLHDYHSKLRLQEQLLSQVLNKNDIRISHLGVIQERLYDQRVFIILDDVDSLDQLEVLANIKWFGPGSRIIVITENTEILHKHGINGIYHVRFPSTSEALMPDAKEICEEIVKNAKEFCDEIVTDTKEICDEIVTDAKEICDVLEDKLDTLSSEAEAEFDKFITSAKELWD